jgi:hypothetical protein
MVSVLISSAVDRGVEPQPGQINGYKIGICCFYANHTALRRKGIDWLAWNRDNVSEWSDMSTRGLLFQCQASIINSTKHVDLVQVDIIYFNLCLSVMLDSLMFIYIHMFSYKYSIWILFMFLKENRGNFNWTDQIYIIGFLLNKFFRINSLILLFYRSAPVKYFTNELSFRDRLKRLFLRNPTSSKWLKRFEYLPIYFVWIWADHLHISNLIQKLCIFMGVISL